jgi:hypothetical protein
MSPTSYQAAPPRKEIIPEGCDTVKLRPDLFGAANRGARMINDKRPSERRAHRDNVEGPFYVANEECMSCGAPEAQAPELMSHDEAGHCFFAAQPSTAKQTTDAILALATSCCGAVRYRGREAEIIRRIAELGEGETCDYPLDAMPGQVYRDRVRFEFRASPGAGTDRGTLREIVECLHTGSSSMRDIDFRSGDEVATFRHSWGTSDNPNQYSIEYSLRRAGRAWVLHAVRKDRPAIITDFFHEFRRNSRFSTIEWFDEKEWKAGRGQPLPF